MTDPRSPRVASNLESAIQCMRNAVHQAEKAHERANDDATATRLVLHALSSGYAGAVVDIEGAMSALADTAIATLVKAQDDDGDALRLAVAHEIDVLVSKKFSIAALGSENGPIEFLEVHDGDALAATRLAIVRAAAASLSVKLEAGSKIK